jgi:hypothetical protein
MGGEKERSRERWRGEIDGGLEGTREDRYLDLSKGA